MGKQSIKTVTLKELEDMKGNLISVSTVAQYLNTRPECIRSLIDNGEMPYALRVNRNYKISRIGFINHMKGYIEVKTI